MDPISAGIIFIFIIALVIILLPDHKSGQAYQDGYFYETKNGMFLITPGTKQEEFQLHEKAKKLEKETARLTAEKTELEGKIGGLEGQVRDLTSKLGELEASKEQEITKTIEVERARHETKLAELFDKVKNKELIIAELEGKVSGLTLQLQQPKITEPTEARPIRETTTPIESKMEAAEIERSLARQALGAGVAFIGSPTPDLKTSLEEDHGPLPREIPIARGVSRSERAARDYLGGKFKTMDAAATAYGISKAAVSMTVKKVKC